ncbi:stalk domain-containing protein [Thermoanaerobacterium sp. DL9XJH110]|uniref:stalk domain-containing protein n=1 Tax=Thermoanaerobacterium sp. DL9XJH110 TaxID=3386643 RepID=UPI003BB65E20
MKRVLLCITLAFIIVSCITPTALAQENKAISIFIDGLPVIFDVEPIIQNGRTLVPFRAIAEALGVQVDWDGETQTVIATDGKMIVKLQIGSKTAYCNEAPTALDVPPVISGGRTLIPLRFFSEAFNCKVEWDGVNRMVKITSPPKDMSVIGFYALGDSRTSSWTNLFGVPYPNTAVGNTDIVDELALGWYSLDKDGNLLTKSRTGWQRPDGWEDVLEVASKYGLVAEMVVHVTDGDGTLTSLLSNDAAMITATSNIIKEAALYQGINLDFEGLGYKEDGEQLLATQRAFNRFVQLLSEQTQKARLTLTLTLHAPNSAYKGYDYKTLSEYADRIIVMAYDYGTKPEPNALVIQAIEQALKCVPKEKLVLGISIPNETPESLLSKVGIAKRYQLEGIALWRLGLLTDEMWGMLKSVVKLKTDNTND